jgi:hypothetical protein
MLVLSFVFGMIFGLPLGILMNYLLGFPTIPKTAPNGFIDWFVVSFTLPLSWLCLWWLFAILLMVWFYSRRDLLKSKRDVGRILLAQSMFPAVLLYTAFIFSLIIIPIDYSLSFLDPLVLPGVLRLVGLLVMLPFIVIFIAIVSPNFRKRIKRKLKSF